MASVDSADGLNNPGILTPCLRCTADLCLAPLGCDGRHAPQVASKWGFLCGNELNTTTPNSGNEAADLKADEALVFYKVFKELRRETG
eukprot:scaffold50503_cov31-Prasinocladus_malaysianus.AAC.1